MRRLSPRRSSSGRAPWLQGYLTDKNMVVLGGWVFSYERGTPVGAAGRAVCRRVVHHRHGRHGPVPRAQQLFGGGGYCRRLASRQGDAPGYRGTLLIRNRLLLGPYSRTIPRVIALNSYAEEGGTAVDSPVAKVTCPCCFL